MYSRVLVPLDGSAAAESALTHAEQVIAPGGELVLMRVVPPGAPAAGDEARAYLAGLQREMEGTERSRSLLAKVTDQVVRRAGVGGEG